MPTVLKSARDVAATVLVLPGWQNSGPRHWQTLWEQQNPIFLRVQQRDWEFPHRDWWLERITAEVKQAPAPIVFAAHSLGCIAVAHWCKASPVDVHKIKGALLVAPVDVDSKILPNSSRIARRVRMNCVRFPPSWWPALRIRISQSHEPANSPAHGAADLSISGLRGISTENQAWATGRKESGC
jgi:hypothetical protein